ncbi:glycoside hydrolase family 3 C-terminal domain-containing protein [Clostridium sp. C105KSO13]|uniref:glycoside hydrolase family 3 C-terminal domain-containing protein n=1 Tax=Clostridium sp. C105KSO13 TaxID=1776045 RepID=UPI000740742B|nr:glycoside hydrolase family 3 C-terminal domain-containing protein [Clostridium sp. C105KSO13]CUX44573.1 Thermostable beta-glucosidase B [Clostridium sp. C105KSO13]
MRHQEIIGKMTLEEKVSLLSGKDFWQTVDIKRLGIPSMTLSDGPHGIRRQAGESDHLGLNASVPATCFPTAATVANSWNPGLGEELGSYLGEEAVSQGVNVLLGPGLNIKRSPLCGRNFEYFSEDPYLAGKMAAGYIKGIQSQGVAACPKHFAANSQELRRMSNDSVLDERTFREIYTTGFEIAVKEGKSKSIMTSYNRINGVYANENEHLLQEILVDEWGFDGFVVSDWGGSNSHTDGVKAGSHLEMPTTGKDGMRELMAAVKEGTLSEELLDRRVDELLSVIFDTQNAMGGKTGKEFDIEKHHAMAERAAEECVVLLKNEDNILPLKQGTKVAVIGDFADKPRYQGAGSSIVNSTKLDSPLDVWKAEESVEFVGYEQGFIRNGKMSEELERKAVELAKHADVVLLYLGLDELAETEGMDREHMKIAYNQIDLLAAVQKANSNIVVVMSAGAPVEMPWLNLVKGMVHGYLAGQAGAGAVANVLTGKVCPSGRLSETYPVSYEDTPIYHCWPGKEKTSEYRESLFVGYRYYETADVPVLFPFGYGLSYTSFAYSDIRADEDKVHVTIQNIGSVDGAEVVQLYVSKPDSKIFRPVKELKGFQKVWLKTGESKTVTIPLDDKAFRYYNVITNKWETEGGSYRIMVGPNVAEVSLSTEVNIEGTEARSPYRKKELPSYYTGQAAEVEDKEFEELLGRPIPDGRWDRSEGLDINDALCQMHYAKSGLARLILRILEHLKNKSMANGEPNLNILFIYNIPFRGIAKMTGGMISMDMVRAMAEVVNGHFFKGMGHLIQGFFANRK